VSELRRILTSSTQDEDGSHLRPFARALIELAIQMLEDEKDEELQSEEAA
jgi:hypothetical protein